MTGPVVIVDYGMGNLHSVGKRLKRLKCEFVVSSDPQQIMKAGKLILPGVGHFGNAMDNLRERKLLRVLDNAVLEEGTPILGICLGMQLMARGSEEGGSEGLGWFDAEVVRFSVEDKLKFKVPHMGWNQVVGRRENELSKGIPDGTLFYFVHSFHVQVSDTSDVLHETNYAYDFASAIQKDNMYGVQYHPEKSHEVGEQLLRNFLDL